MPRVSVIMSVYNNSNSLGQAISSVLEQNFSDFEFIIIDDGSTDGTEHVVKGFGDRRIVYLKNSSNMGLVSGLNRGLGVASGEYIARIDGDDWWSDKDKISKQVAFLDKHEGFALVGTWAQVYDVEKKELYKISNPFEWTQINKMMLCKNCFVHSSVLFRKSVAVSCGGYSEPEKYIEDYGLWLRMGEKNKLANVPEFCVGYTHNDVGETQKNNLSQIEGILKLIKKHRKNYPNYFLARLRWSVKYLIVFCGGLRLINKYKNL